MDRHTDHHIPDSPPKTDDSEAFDSEKYASRRDQRRPDRGLGFVPVDEAIHQGELFGEKVQPSAHASPTEEAPAKTSGRKDGNRAFPKKPEADTFEDKAPEDHDSDDVDEALEETFPASDPASYSPGTATPSNIKDKDDAKT